MTRMIVVKIEKWPGGNEEKAELLGQMVIHNDETSTDPVIGHYVIALSESGGAWRRSRVTNFPRTEGNALDLLFRALIRFIGHRNADDKPDEETEGDHGAVEGDPLRPVIELHDLEGTGCEGKRGREGRIVPKPKPAWDEN